MSKQLLWSVKARFTDQDPSAPPYLLKVLAPNIREAVTIVENSRPEDLFVIETVAIDFVYLTDTETPVEDE